MRPGGSAHPSTQPRRRGEIRMFPSTPSRALDLILRAAALLLICLLPQGCQDQNGGGGGQTMSPYMRDCAANGVPLPPVWGDPNWKKKGSITDNNKVFDAGNETYSETQVWTYASAQPKDQKSV